MKFLKIFLSKNMVKPIIMQCINNDFCNDLSVFKKYQCFISNKDKNYINVIDNSGSVNKYEKCRFI